MKPTTTFQLNDRKVYATLLALFVACFLARLGNIGLPGWMMSHISNFAITGGLFLISSDILIFKKPYTKKRLLLEMLPFALLNVIIEVFVRVDIIKISFVRFINFNTPDPIDMCFGLASLAVIYFVLIKYSEKTEL